MLHTFPNRTLGSDQEALRIHQYLAPYTGKMRNRMICAVTTREHLVVSISGGNFTPAAEARLRSCFHSNGANPYINIAHENPMVAEWVSASPKFTNRTQRFFAAGAAASPRDSQPDDLHFHDQRLCAEPKALLLAGKRGWKPLGMTVFWTGKKPTSYLDSPNLSTHHTRPCADKFGFDTELQFARPCEHCLANEARLMHRVQKYLKKGPPRRAITPR